MEHRKKKFQLSIRTAMVAGFMVISLLIAIIAISSQFFWNKHRVQSSVVALYQQTLGSLSELLISMDSNATQQIYQLAQLPTLAENSLISEENRQILAAVMQRHQFFQSISIGKENGDVNQLINLQASSDLRRQFQAEKADRWLLISWFNEVGQPQRRLEYYDDAFNLRHAWQHQSDVDMSTQLWITNAKTDEVIRSLSLNLADINIPTQNYSLKLPDSNTVLAITVDLSSLEALLQNGDIGEQTHRLIYAKAGKIIASNQPELTQTILPEAPALELNGMQRALIENNSLLRVSSETDWPPLNFAKNGMPTGYAVDVLHYVSRMTGLEMQFITGSDWQGLATQFVNGDLEIMQPVFYSEFRNFMGEMTIPFVDVPYGIMTTSQPPISHISALAGKTVAIPEGWSLTGRLQSVFPDITIIEKQTTRDVFEAVSRGEVDAGMDAAIALQYYLSTQESVEDMMVHQGVDFAPAQIPSELHFMVTRLQPGLADIFNQALENLTEKHHQALIDKWFNSIDTPHSYETFNLEQIKNEDLSVSDELQSISFKEKDYLAFHQAIEISGWDKLFLTIIAPQNNLMGSIWSQTQSAILVAGLMLLLLWPLSWWLASMILSALKKLHTNMGLLEQRNFAAVDRSPSHLIELNILGDKLFEVSHSVQDYQLAQQRWVDAMVQSVAHAIDAKSAYPTQHCALVPELSMLLADEADKSNDIAFKQFQFEDESQRREFHLAAWMHSYGKITSPEYLVDKRTKLEMIYNRIHEIRMRFEVLWRDAEIEFWQQTYKQPENREMNEAALSVKQHQLSDDFAFVAHCNLGTEFMDHNTNDRLKRLAKMTWERHFDDQLGLSPVELDEQHPSNAALPVTEQLLADKTEHLISRPPQDSEEKNIALNIDPPEYLFNHGELYNLTIESGTLTQEDRYKINEHILTTIKMLEAIPYPDELSEIPRLATSHLEAMNGNGYPRGLTADDLSVPERILMLANVFEALTAADRPYKKAKTLSVAIFILHQLVEQGVIDRDVFELFLTSGVYQLYAERFMTSEQIDTVDISQFLRDANH